MMVSGPHQIGSVYKKAKYFEYTDNTFSQKRNRTADNEYLGILGPVLRAEVGETIEVVFKNLASRPYSFIPFGVSLEKSEEGSVYLNANGKNVFASFEFSYYCILLSPLPATWLGFGGWVV